MRPAIINIIDQLKGSPDSQFIAGETEKGLGHHLKIPDGIYPVTLENRRRSFTLFAAAVVSSLAAACATQKNRPCHYHYHSTLKRIAGPLMAGEYHSRHAECPRSQYHHPRMDAVITSDNQVILSHEPSIINTTRPDGSSASEKGPEHLQNDLCRNTALRCRTETQSRFSGNNRNWPLPSLAQ